MFSKVYDSGKSNDDKIENMRILKQKKKYYNLQLLIGGFKLALRFVISNHNGGSVETYNSRSGQTP